MGTALQGQMRKEHQGLYTGRWEMFSSPAKPDLLVR